MKLVIVTSVEEFHQDVLKLFKQASIENLSSSKIDGHRNKATILNTSDWFTGQKNGTESTLFFSFTDDEHIDTLFKSIEDFNKKLETNTPLKAIVLPIEKFI